MSESIDVADRCPSWIRADVDGGLYRFAPLSDRVEIYVEFFARDRERTYVEYRGTDEDLIAMKVITPSALASSKGRRRVDSAGRWVVLRRYRGLRRVFIDGDPLAAPALPGLAREHLAEARQDLDRYWREKHPERRNSESAKRVPTQPQMPTRASFCEISLKNISFAVDDRGSHWPDDPLPAESNQRIRQHVEAIRAELSKARAAVTQSRPAYLRLIVDNTGVGS